MKRISPWALLAGLGCLGLDGCHSKEKPAALAQPVATENQPAVISPANTPTEALSAARNSLKAGNVDEAAAKLAELQVKGASFNAQQAKDYRQTLSEAYDRAIEGVQRGDPRAQAALQLLRTAAPR